MAIEDRNTFGVLGNGGEEAEGLKVTYFSLTLLGAGDTDMFVL